jgi:hypothetical protein
VGPALVLTSPVTASRTRSGDPLTDVVDLIERNHRELEEQLATLAATLEVAEPRQLCTALDGHVGAEERALGRAFASAKHERRPNRTEA